MFPSRQTSLKGWSWFSIVVASPSSAHLGNVASGFPLPNHWWANSWTVLPAADFGSFPSWSWTVTSMCEALVWAAHALSPQSGATTIRTASVGIAPNMSSIM